MIKLSGWVTEVRTSVLLLSQNQFPSINKYTSSNNSSPFSFYAYLTSFSAKKNKYIKLSLEQHVFEHSFYLVNSYVIGFFDHKRKPHTNNTDNGSEQISLTVLEDGLKYVKAHTCTSFLFVFEEPSEDPNTFSLFFFSSFLNFWELI